MTIYIIEHLEPKVFRWCLIEYKNISKIVGSTNLWFTNIKRKNKNLEALGKTFKQSVSEMGLKNACVLDPEAKELLNPREARQFDYFIFGGILGDNPPRKRTTPELTSKIKGADVRNIGKKQFSTDNAVFVTKKIVEGTSLENIRCIDTITIKINKIESVELPYCYPLIGNKPQISEELVSYLRRKRGF